MLRRAIVGSGAVIALALSSIVAAPPSQAVTNIRVGVYAESSGAALQFAQDAGIMYQNGINVVQVTIYPAPPAALAALAGGAVDIITSPIVPVINANVNGGMALKILAPTFGFSGSDIKRAKADAAYAALVDNSAMCVRNGSGITSWKDLSGKKVALPARKAIGEVAITQQIRAAGGDPATVNWTILGLPQVIPNLLNGMIDAAYTVQPWTEQCLANGMKSIGSPNISFMEPQDSAVSVWVTTQTWAAANPSAVVAFQKSMYQAHKFAMANKANGVKVLESASKLTKQPVEVARAGRRPYFLLKVTAADIAAQGKKMQEMGFIPTPVNVAGLLVKQYQP